MQDECCERTSGGEDGLLADRKLRNTLVPALEPLASLLTYSDLLYLLCILTLMTWPTPMVHWKGDPRSRDESNLEPSRRVPTSMAVSASAALDHPDNAELPILLTVDGDLVALLREGLAVALGDTLEG
jgi:hypothetical protein